MHGIFIFFKRVSRKYVQDHRRLYIQDQKLCNVKKKKKSFHNVKMLLYFLELSLLSYETRET